MLSEITYMSPTLVYERPMVRRRFFGDSAMAGHDSPNRHAAAHQCRRQQREQHTRENAGVAVAFIHQPNQVEAALLPRAVGIAAAAAAALIEGPAQLGMLVVPRPPAIGAGAERPHN